MHHARHSYFGQKVYVDTVGPLTGTVFEGKMVRHFLTIYDGYTKWLVATPITSPTVEAIADAFV